MERQHIYKLIETKGTSSKEETNELWDIVRTFPYFQTARLLLAKSFQKQSSIHFHNELKTAAAYASDRKILFQILHADRAKQPSIEESNVFAIETKETVEDVPVFKTSIVSSENQFALSPEREEYIEEPVRQRTDSTGQIFEIKKETKTPEVKFKEETETHKEEKIAEREVSPEPIISDSDEPATTNEETIRRRLGEILSRNKPEKQEIVSAVPPSKVEETIVYKEDVTEEKPVQADAAVTKEEGLVIHSTLDTLPGETTDVLEGLELETIIEETYLQELEKLPEIAPLAPQRGENASYEASVLTPLLGGRGAVSFIDWLKQKTGGHTTVEEVIDEPLSADNDLKSEIASPPSGERGALIDKFIATTPSITPIKAEFYSPANMARQSIMDNEDIVSETLASIYFEQGNYMKARSCYEKLSLLYPEKSASFAPLIEKIDNLLKEEN